MKTNTYLFHAANEGTVAHLLLLLPAEDVRRCQQVPLDDGTIEVMLRMRNTTVAKLRAVMRRIPDGDLMTITVATAERFVDRMLARSGGRQ